MAFFNNGSPRPDLGTAEFTCRFISSNAKQLKSVSRHAPLSIFGRDELDAAPLVGHSQSLIAKLPQSFLRCRRAEGVERNITADQFRTEKPPEI